MKKLLLATTKNFQYRESLAKNGFLVTECNLPALTVDLDTAEQCQPYDLCVAEISKEIIEANPGLYPLIGGKTRVLCLADQIGKPEREFLFGNGISDLLMRPQSDQLFPYLKIMNETSSGDSGSIVILDDNSSVIAILSKIVERFNYTPVIIGSVDELFNSALNLHVRFVLANLGVRLLDLNGLVRKFYGTRQAGLIPVMVYKDMHEGLFVHELVSGLNRLTRFILSLDELYSLLVDILFKKEIMPHIASIKELSDFDNLSSYSVESVSRIFFMDEKKIFTQANILCDKNFDELMNLGNMIKKSLLKVLGLKWLRIDMDKKDLSIAGTEV